MRKARTGQGLVVMMEGGGSRSGDVSTLRVSSSEDIFPVMSSMPVSDYWDSLSNYRVSNYLKSSVSVFS